MKFCIWIFEELPFCVGNTQGEKKRHAHNTFKGEQPLIHVNGNADIINKWYNKQIDIISKLQWEGEKGKDIYIFTLTRLWGIHHQTTKQKPGFQSQPLHSPDYGGFTTRLGSKSLGSRVSHLSVHRWGEVSWSFGMVWDPSSSWLGLRNTKRSTCFWDHLLFFNN